MLRFADAPILLAVECSRSTPGQFQTTWNDSGTRTDYDLQAWQGKPPLGFYLVGDLAEAAGSDWIYGSQPRGALLALCDISSDGDRALAPITSFSPRSNNAGSIGGDWGSVWWLNPPVVYIALGCAIVASEETAPASGAYCAVNPALLLQGQVGPQIFAVGLDGQLPFQDVQTLNPAYVQWVTQG